MQSITVFFCLRRFLETRYRRHVAFVVDITQIPHEEMIRLRQPRAGGILDMIAPKLVTLHGHVAQEVVVHHLAVFLGQAVLVPVVAVAKVVAATAVVELESQRVFRRQGATVVAPNQLPRAHPRALRLEETGHGGMIQKRVSQSLHVFAVADCGSCNGCSPC
jgi:hypothetical protein